MQVKVTNRFFKDLEAIDDKTTAAEALTLIEIAETAESIYELPNLKKLKGYKNAFRVRLGDYRVGLLRLDGDTASFERCLHRKEVYKYFP